jgi:hypothetical protein
MSPEVLSTGQVGNFQWRWRIACQECTLLLGGNTRVGRTIYEKEYKALLKQGWGPATPSVEAG